MVFYATGVYKGFHSDQLFNNHTYPVEIITGLFGSIKVYVVQGYENRRMAGTETKYTSLKDFLTDWEIKVPEPKYIS